MKRLIPILLIFLTFSIMQFGQQKKTGTKPKIGLLTFSVNAFDEESKKIGKYYRTIIERIQERLEKHFEITQEFPDIITYADIEDFEVTIDPVVEPETNKKLEKLCQKDWDGLVFGHFHQEDKLVVVTRFYISKNKYPGIKKDERIISSPEIEIPMTNLGQKSLETHTAQSIQELIEAIKTKKSEIFGMVKKEEKKEPPPKIKEPPKKVTQPTPQDTKAPVKKKKPEIEEDYGVAPLTAKDVYKMVIEKGFYCEIVKGSPFHGEGLEGISIPKNGIFKDKRVVTAVEKKGLIKTESKLVKQDGDKIPLWWNPGKKIKCTYRSAEQIIDRLNNESKDKNKRWRIPTIMELFSVVRFEDTNHFPPAFKFPTKDKDLIFWTSTPVKKEGTVLSHDKNNKAYFVLRSLYGESNGQYSLTFAPLNIKRNPPNEAYLLPVYSDKIYAYKRSSGSQTSTSAKVPGFDDKDKIPGFDDTPETAKSPTKKTASSPSLKIKTDAGSKKSDGTPKKTNNQGKVPGFDDVPNKSIVPQRPSKKEPIVSPPQPFKNAKSPARAVRIALFPYMSGIMTPEEKRLLDDLNNAIKEALKRVEDNLKHTYNPKLKLKIKKMNPNGDDLSDITRFYSFLSSTNESDSDKANNITRHIMIPEEIDLIVTTIYFNTPINNPIAFPIESPKHMLARHTFKPLIIDGFNNKIKRNNVILQTKPIIDLEYGPVIRVINKAIIEIIKSEFKKSPGKKKKSRRK